MGDKLLKYTLAVSIGLHLIVLAFVGASYAARSIEPEDLKLVQVKVVDMPETKPVPENVKTEPDPGEPDRVSLPAPEKLQTAPVPKPRPKIISQPKPQPKASPPAPKPGLLSGIANIFQRQPDAPVKPAGDPGGALNTGTGSSHGQDLGGGGHTPTGWVPGSPGGKGTGSGSGEGTGKPEPVKGATPGPGKEPAPPPPPPPPPPDVDARVCADSGMIPSANCERTVVKSYRPGKQPDSKCTACKPQFVSTLADRSTPELISGPKSPKYPESAKRRGTEGTVVVEYTIDTEGKVVGVKVSSSSGNSDLDRAATDCVSGRKYKPAVQGGIPRSYRKRETFTFTLG